MFWRTLGPRGGFLRRQGITENALDREGGEERREEGGVATRPKSPP